MLFIRNGGLPLASLAACVLLPLFLSEVHNMMLYEYDEAKHYESLRREGERRGEARSDEKWEGIVAEKDAHISKQDARLSKLGADIRRLQKELAIARGTGA